ncbi:MAG: anhydro-N-acetylmuramic acid kinase [Crocinitomicaceae bacterium]|nr:anhydro-N-acetylmuramic acid kinase [Crocinitomicaceae bacterium]
MPDFKTTRVIGLMSGTSLDGLDCCCADFYQDNTGYQFKIIAAKTFTYSVFWKNKLQQAFYLPPEKLAELSAEYGLFLSECVNQFQKEFKLENGIDLIASHGHTVFHQPAKGITVQIGDGEILNKKTGIRVINDFRIKDVQLGGQGAPLVPVGDHFLFSDFDACLNLGGFSNISFIHNNERIAFDIGPANLPLNILCQRFFNCDFDRNGEISKSGNLLEDLRSELNDLNFFKIQPPKSLGFEWLKEEYLTVIEKYIHENPADLITTVTQQVADQIIKVTENYHLKSILITGGGAYNDNLINYLKKSNIQIIIPSPEIVEFKEALIFAFLGYLNLNNSINTFKSVTGAREDSTGGIRHFGHQQ